MGGILDFFKKDKITKKELVEQDVCPSCWSMEEYQDQFSSFVEASSHEEKGLKKAERMAFIQKFVHTHVPSISLKDDTGNRKHCNTCAGKF